MPPLPGTAMAEQCLDQVRHCPDGEAHYPLRDLTTILADLQAVAV